MRSASAALLLALASLACRDRSEPTAIGERVELTTDVVTQVCGGTIAALDAEVARIEAELGLDPHPDPVDIHVVSDERIAEHCDGGRRVCVVQPPRAIYLSASAYAESIRYELARDRLTRTTASASKPLLFEGTAGALTLPSCAPIDGWEPPAATTVLAATSRDDLGSEGRYLGGELLRWLLDTRGPTPVLELMSSVDRYDRSSSFRVAYLEQLASNIDVDLYAHWRPDDAPVDPGRAGCLAPALELDEATSRYRLTAEFDCGSDRVQTDFAEPSRLFVEWTLELDAASADMQGELAGDWLGLLAPLPDGVSLTVERCACEPEPWSQPSFGGGAQPWDHEVPQRLKPGRYRVRAYAPPGASLDVEIQAPCEFERQNCAAGQQCTSHGDCVPAVDDPAQLGDPCPSFPDDPDAPLPCDVGLVCLGPYDGEGVCVPACDDDGLSCPDALECTNFDACATACDPLAPSCEDAWSCVPDLAAGTGACIPGPADRGVLEPCTLIDFSCAPGLTCERIDSIEGCYDPDAWLDLSGCCTPVCDPAAPDPGCPAQLPNCLVGEDHLLGTCQP